MRLRSYLIAAMGCCLAGCSQEPDRPATYPVRGKVTYQGQPVSGAAIAFLAPGAPAPAVGTSDSAGAFSLSTFVPNDGAVAGEHVVTVKKYDDASATEAPTGGNEADASPEAIEKAMQQSGLQALEARKKGSVLPARYAKRQTTDLRVEVKAGENNVVLELKD